MSFATPMVGYSHEGELNKESKVKYNWNVITETDFKERVRRVFKAVSSALTNTLGPYGSTTIIEQYGEMHVTKDGWQVLKNIHFKDTTDNNILMLLLRISAQVVLKVGDGSTSSIVAANAILEEMEKRHEEIKYIRSKDFMTILNHCVKLISDEIYSSSNKVNKETYDEIYKLAYVATNGDDNIADMIQTIYKKTNNPTIEYVKSKDDKTYYEIVDGYKLENLTYIDSIFVTNNEDGTCEIKNPLFLLFDHKVTLEQSSKLINAALDKAYDTHRRLVVVAPYFDKYFLESVQKSINVEFKARGTSTIVYARVSLVNNLSHHLYNDFAVMCGAEIIKEQLVEEFEGLDADQLKEAIHNTYIGETELTIIGAKDTVVKGFIKRNENMYNKVMDDAILKYNNMEKDYRDKGIVDTKLTEHKNRVTKLRGSMGIIHVGGYSTLEKKANYDLIEDAIKACESATLYGFNCGGNLVIPHIIKGILSNNDISVNERLIYEILSDAFKNVFKTVLKNKYSDENTVVLSKDDMLNDIIDNCIYNEKLIAYNLITEEYSTDVINSCITDIEILRATASIISLLISSNQYISILQN